MNQFPPSPRVSHKDRFEFFRKFAEIFTSQGAPPVSKIPVVNLPPVSTTPAAKLPLVSTTPAANLPPVSATPEANFATSFASVVDTGNKFATGVNDAGGGKLPPVLTTSVANLPPVKMTQVANNGNNYQTADNLKWTWRKKFIYMLTLLPKGAKEIMQIFLIEDDTGGAPWAVNLPANFRKKFKTIQMV